MTLLYENCFLVHRRSMHCCSGCTFVHLSVRSPIDGQGHISRSTRYPKTDMPGLVLSSPAALGFSIPPNEQHATSVSLPTWLDCTDYEKGHARVVDAMQIGYPRFFVNKIITKVRSCVESCTQNI